MSNTKVVVYGYDAASETYVPLAVDRAGFINVHVTAVSDNVVMRVLGTQRQNTDDIDPGDSGSIISNAYGYGFNGSTFDRLRIANVYKTHTMQAAGTDTIWTPALGNKFRLMGYNISVCGNVAVLGPVFIILSDGTDNRFNHVVGVGATVSGDSQIAANLGQGFLSVAQNNALTMTISDTLLTGAVTINAWGVEETP